jgi:formamidopyrimidine-DNA glycosylase
MPELPEVETVRRGLSGRAVGRVVARVRVGHPGILEDCDRSDLDTLAGSVLERFDRHGKYLLVRLGPRRRRTLVVHLGMSGQFVFQAPGESVVEGTVRMPSGYVKTRGPHPVDQHTHLVLDCADGGRFLFRDPRRFGRILLLEGWEEADHPRLRRLGPDALGMDPAVLAARLADGCGSRVAKVVLLDQSVVAGVGNIYADEACFEAGIRPTAVLRGLSRPRRHRLAEAVLEALDRGVRNSGTTFRDFVSSDGEPGRNAEDLRVYGRGGLPCLRCGSPLVESVVATRGTVHCPRCQR